MSIVSLASQTLSPKEQAADVPISAARSEGTAHRPSDLEWRIEVLTTRLYPESQTVSQREILASPLLPKSPLLLETVVKQYARGKQALIG